MLNPISIDGIIALLLIPTGVLGGNVDSTSSWVVSLILFNDIWDPYPATSILIIKTSMWLLINLSSVADDLKFNKT